MGIPVDVKELAVTGETGVSQGPTGNTGTKKASKFVMPQREGEKKSSKTKGFVMPKREGEFERGKEGETAIAQPATIDELTGDYTSEELVKTNHKSVDKMKDGEIVTGNSVTVDAAEKAFDPEFNESLTEFDVQQDGTVAKVDFNARVERENKWKTQRAEAKERHYEMMKPYYKDYYGGLENEVKDLELQIREQEDKVIEWLELEKAALARNNPNELSVNWEEGLTDKEKHLEKLNVAYTKAIESRAEKFATEHHPDLDEASREEFVRAISERFQTDYTNAVLRPKLEKIFAENNMIMPDEDIKLADSDFLALRDYYHGLFADMSKDYTASADKLNAEYKVVSDTHNKQAQVRLNNIEKAIREGTATEADWYALRDEIDAEAKDMYNRHTRKFNEQITGEARRSQKSFENKFQEDITKILNKYNLFDAGEEIKFKAGYEEKVKKLSEEVYNEFQRDKLDKQMQRWNLLSGDERFFEGIHAGTADVIQSVGGAVGFIQQQFGILGWMGGFETARHISNYSTAMLDSRPLMSRMPEHFYESIGYTPEQIKEFEGEGLVGEFTMADMGSANWWQTKFARILPFSIAFMAPGLGVGGLASGALVKFLAGRAWSKAAKTMFHMTGSGLAGAITMRPMESLFEAGSLWAELMDNGASIKEASEKASEVYWKNMNLLGLDALQIGIAFTPMKGVFGKLGKLFIEAGSNYAEEVYQEYWQAKQSNPLLTFMEYATSPEGIEVGMLGATLSPFFMAPEMLGSSSKANGHKAKTMVDLLNMGNNLEKRIAQLKDTFGILKANGAMTEKEYEKGMFAIRQAGDVVKMLKGEDNMGMRAVQLAELGLKEYDLLQKIKSTDSKSLTEALQESLNTVKKEMKEIVYGTAPGYFINGIPMEKEEMQKAFKNPEFMESVVTGINSVSILKDNKIEEEYSEAFEKSQNETTQQLAKISDARMGLAFLIREEGEKVNPDLRKIKRWEEQLIIVNKQYDELTEKRDKERGIKKKKKTTGKAGQVEVDEQAKTEITEIEKERKEETEGYGKKEIVSGLSSLKRTKDPIKRAERIRNLRSLISQGATLTKQQKADLKNEIKRLKDEGYTVSDKTGKQWTDKDTGTANKVLYEELKKGESVIISTITEEIKKDGKIIQEGKYVVAVGTNPKGMSADEFMASRATAVSGMNIKYDERVEKAKKQSQARETKTKDEQGADAGRKVKIEKEEEEKSVEKPKPKKEGSVREIIEQAEVELGMTLVEYGEPGKARREGRKKTKATGTKAQRKNLSILKEGDVLQIKYTDREHMTDDELALTNRENKPYDHLMVLTKSGVIVGAIAYNSPQDEKVIELMVKGGNKLRAVVTSLNYFDGAVAGFNYELLSGDMPGGGSQTELFSLDVSETSMMQKVRSKVELFSKARQFLANAARSMTIMLSDKSIEVVEEMFNTAKDKAKGIEVIHGLLLKRATFKSGKEKGYYQGFVREGSAAHMTYAAVIGDAKPIKVHSAIYYPLARKIYLKTETEVNQDIETARKAIRGIYKFKSANLNKLNALKKKYRKFIELMDSDNRKEAMKRWREVNDKIMNEFDRDMTDARGSLVEILNEMMPGQEPLVLKIVSLMSDKLVERIVIEKMTAGSTSRRKASMKYGKKLVVGENVDLSGDAFIDELLGENFGISYRYVSAAALELGMPRDINFQAIIVEVNDLIHKQELEGKDMSQEDISAMIHYHEESFIIPGIRNYMRETDYKYTKLILLYMAGMKLGVGAKTMSEVLQRSKSLVVRKIISSFTGEERRDALRGYRVLEKYTDMLRTAGMITKSIYRDEVGIKLNKGKAKMLDFIHEIMHYIDDISLGTEEHDQLDVIVDKTLRDKKVRNFFAKARRIYREELKNSDEPWTQDISDEDFDQMMKREQFAMVLSSIMAKEGELWEIISRNKSMLESLIEAIKKFFAKFFSGMEVKKNDFNEFTETIEKVMANDYLYDNFYRKTEEAFYKVNVKERKTKPKSVKKQLAEKHELFSLETGDEETPEESIDRKNETAKKEVDNIVKANPVGSKIKISFHIKGEDIEVETEINKIEIFTTGKRSDGAIYYDVAVDLTNVKTGKKYAFVVGTDGFVSQTLSEQDKLFVGGSTLVYFNKPEIEKVEDPDQLEMEMDWGDEAVDEEETFINAKNEKEAVKLFSRAARNLVKAGLKDKNKIITALKLDQAASPDSERINKIIDDNIGAIIKGAGFVTLNISEKSEGIVISKDTAKELKRSMFPELTENELNDYEDEDIDVGGDFFVTQEKRIQAQREVFRKLINFIAANTDIVEPEREIYKLMRTKDFAKALKNPRSYRKFLKEFRKTQPELADVLENEGIITYDEVISLQVFYGSLILLQTISTSHHMSGDFDVINKNQEGRVEEYEGIIYETLRNFTYNEFIEPDMAITRAYSDYFLDIKGKSKITTYRETTEHPEGSMEYLEGLIDIYSEFLSLITGINKEVWNGYFTKSNEKNFILKRGTIAPDIIKYMQSLSSHKGPLTKTSISSAMFHYIVDPAASGKSQSNLVKLINSAIIQDNISFVFNNVKGNREISFELYSTLHRQAEEIQELADHEKYENNDFVQWHASEHKKARIIKYNGATGNATKNSAEAITMDGGLTSLVIMGMFAKGYKTGDTYFQYLGQFGDKKQAYFVEVKKYNDAKERYTKLYESLPIEHQSRMIDPSMVTEEFLLDQFEEIITSSGAFGEVEKRNKKEDILKIAGDFFYNYALNKYWATMALQGDITSYENYSGFVKRAGSTNSPGYVPNPYVDGGIGHTHNHIVADDFENERGEKVFDGIVFMTQEFADKLQKSLGSILSRSMKFDMMDSSKALMSWTDDDQMRGLTKGNIIVIDNLAKAFPSSKYAKVFEYMNDNDADMLSFAPSTTKISQETRAKIFDGKGDFIKDTNGPISVRDNSNLFVQQDLRSNTHPSKGKLPKQSLANLLHLEISDEIIDLFNRYNEYLIADLDKYTEDEWRSKILEAINEEQLPELYEYLFNGGKIENPFHDKMIRRIQSAIITQEAFEHRVSRTGLQEIPDSDNLCSPMQVVQFKGEDQVRLARVNLNIEGLRYSEDSPVFSKLGSAISYASRFDDMLDENGNVKEWEIEKIKVKGKIRYRIPGEYVFTTRVPADFLHSHVVHRAQNRIPGAGNVIMTDSLTQERAGADFDGDKRFVMSYNRNRKGDIIRQKSAKVSKPIDISDSSKKTKFFKKDKKKFARTNKMVAFGEPGTSSRAYGEAVAENQLNVGEYSPDDVVGYSVNGSNNAEVDAKKVIEELDIAMKAGATIIGDRKSDRKRTYNTGERIVAEHLELSRYEEVADGIWEPVQGKKGKSTVGESQHSRSSLMNEVLDLTAKAWTNPENFDIINHPINKDAYNNTVNNIVRHKRYGRYADFVRKMVTGQKLATKEDFERSQIMKHKKGSSNVQVEPNKADVNLSCIFLYSMTYDELFNKIAWNPEYTIDDIDPKDEESIAELREKLLLYESDENQELLEMRKQAHTLAYNVLNDLIFIPELAKILDDELYSILEDFPEYLQVFVPEENPILAFFTEDPFELADKNFKPTLSDYGDRKFNSFTTDMQTRDEITSARKAISIFANLSTVWSFIRKAKLELKNSINIAFPIIESGNLNQVNKTIKLNKFTEDKFNIIKNHFGNILNMLLDNTNDPKTEVMGWNETTVEMGAFLLITNPLLDNAKTPERYEELVINWVDRISAWFNTPVVQEFIRIQRQRKDPSRYPISEYKMFKELKRKFGVDAVKPLEDVFEASKNLNEFHSFIKLLYEVPNTAGKLYAAENILYKIRENKTDMRTNKLMEGGEMIDLFKMAERSYTAAVTKVFGNSIETWGVMSSVIKSITAAKKQGKTEKWQRDMTETEVDKTVREAKRLLASIMLSDEITFVDMEKGLINFMKKNSDNAFIKLLQLSNYRLLSSWEIEHGKTTNQYIQIRENLKNYRPSEESIIDAKEAYNNLPDHIQRYFMAYSMMRFGLNTSTWNGNFSSMFHINAQLRLGNLMSEFGKASGYNSIFGFERIEIERLREMIQIFNPDLDFTDKYKIFEKKKKDGRALQEYSDPNAIVDFAKELMVVGKEGKRLKIKSGGEITVREHFHEHVEDDAFKSGLYYYWEEEYDRVYKPAGMSFPAYLIDKAKRYDIWDIRLKKLLFKEAVISVTPRYKRNLERIYKGKIITENNKDKPNIKKIKLLQERLAELEKTGVVTDEEVGFGKEQISTRTEYYKTLDKILENLIINSSFFTGGNEGTMQLSILGFPIGVWNSMIHLIRLLLKGGYEVDVAVSTVLKLIFNPSDFVKSVKAGPMAHILMDNNFVKIVNAITADEGLPKKLTAMYGNIEGVYEAVLKLVNWEISLEGANTKESRIKGKDRFMMNHGYVAMQYLADKFKGMMTLISIQEFMRVVDRSGSLDEDMVKEGFTSDEIAGMSTHMKIAIRQKNKRQYSDSVSVKPVLDENQHKKSITHPRPLDQGEYLKLKGLGHVSKALEDKDVDRVIPKGEMPDYIYNLILELRNIGNLHQVYVEYLISIGRVWVEVERLESVDFMRLNARDINTMRRVSDMLSGIDKAASEDVFQYLQHILAMKYLRDQVMRETNEADETSPKIATIVAYQMALHAGLTDFKKTGWRSMWIPQLRQLILHRHEITHDTPGVQLFVKMLTLKHRSIKDESNYIKKRIGEVLRKMGGININNYTEVDEDTGTNRKMIKPSRIDFEQFYGKEGNEDKKLAFWTLKSIYGTKDFNERIDEVTPWMSKKEIEQFKAYYDLYELVFEFLSKYHPHYENMKRIGIKPESIAFPSAFMSYQEYIRKYWSKGPKEILGLIYNSLKPSQYDNVLIAKDETFGQRKYELSELYREGKISQKQFLESIHDAKKIAKENKTSITKAIEMVRSDIKKVPGSFFGYSELHVDFQTNSTAYAMELMVESMITAHHMKDLEPIGNYLLDKYGNMKSDPHGVRMSATKYLEREINRQIYGIEELTNLQIFGKGLRMATTYAAYVALPFNALAFWGNFAAGHLQNLVHEPWAYGKGLSRLAVSMFYVPDPQSMVKEGAKAGFVPALFVMQKARNIMKAYEIANITEEVDLTKSRNIWKMLGSFAFLSVEVAEMLIQIPAFLGMITEEEFNAYDRKGKVRTVEIEEGGLIKKVKDPHAMTTERAEQIRNRLLNIHGAYGWSRAQYSNWQIGRTIGQFWFPWFHALFQNTWGRYYGDYFGVARIGYFNALATEVKVLIYNLSSTGNPYDDSMGKSRIDRYNKLQEKVSENPEIFYTLSLSDQLILEAQGGRINIGKDVPSQVHASLYKALVMGAIVAGYIMIRKWIDEELELLTKETITVLGVTLSINDRPLSEIPESERRKILLLKAAKKIINITLNDVFIPFDPTGWLTTLAAGGAETGFFMDKIGKPFPMMFALEGVGRLVYSALSGEEFEKHGYSFAKGDKKWKYYLQTLIPAYGPPFKTATRFSRMIYSKKELQMLKEGSEREGRRAWAHEYALRRYSSGILEEGEERKFVKDVVTEMVRVYDPNISVVKAKTTQKERILQYKIDMHDREYTMHREEIDWLADVVYAIMENLDKFDMDELEVMDTSTGISDAFHKKLMPAVMALYELKKERLEFGPPEKEEQE